MAQKVRHYDIGFFSSADRGLDCLLEMIPRIEKKLGKKITSIWAYGWNTFDQFHKQNPEKMKWKWQVIRKMNDVGMESKGRLNHQELAKLMKDTKVWAYPTEFTEIYCITAVKAQEAACTVVATKVGALPEVIQKGWLIDCQDIYTNKKKQSEFIDAVVESIQSNGRSLGFATLNDVNPLDIYWPDVAKKWNKALK